ncbi:MAG: replication initiator protein [Microviridae sp.]|nr:MAG: replication initiator protein [Microviridae sp.]
MPCYSPLHGYKSRLLTASGKRKIVFSAAAGYSDLAMTVPCGQCIGCRIDRSRQWALRCVHESKLHIHNSFVTLTYDDDNLPLGHSLQKRDLQLFFKKLRKNYAPFRYFACGEYGDQTRRPHYHIIFFGIDFHEDRKKHSTGKRGNPLYTSQTLQNAWPYGHSSVGEFNYATAAYTARYIMKKQLGKDSANRDAYTRFDSVTGELFQVTPEFSLMSRKPGIGTGWYEKYSSDAFPSDFLVHEGKKHPVPRFYFNKLEKEAPDVHQLLKTKRAHARKSDYANNTPDRLYTREEVKLSKIKQLTRDL